MALLPLDIQPGVYRNGTQMQSAGRFYDADLWRWFEGTQRPVGGWRLKSETAVSGKARALLTWMDNSNQAWVVVGTHSGLYVYTRSGAQHDITPAGFTAGDADASTGGGYGTGLYGAGTYGTPRPDDTNTIPASVWTLDTWGENLVGCFDGAIYEWALDTGLDAVAVTNAPSAEAVLVTEERAMFALGAGGDPRKVEWSDLEDNTDWTPTGTNQAGGKALQTAGRLQCGKRIRGGVLLFTDVDVHLATYAGLPRVYDFERVGSACGIISRQGVAVVDGRAFWMGANRFWSYNGGVEPLECDVGDYVFSNINRAQISKVTAMHNSQFGEVWWLYPSASSTEIDRYVVYNYREGHWSIGALSRLCGADRGVLPYPLMVDADGYLYEHEVGQSRDGRQPFADSGPIELGAGDRTMEVNAVIPDEQTLGEVTVSFTVSDWPMDAEETVGPYDAASKTDCRFSGRRVAPKFIAAADVDFRLGVYRFDVKAGSPR